MFYITGEGGSDNDTVFSYDKVSLIEIPHEDNSATRGQLRIEEKKYNYNSNNVMILNVENNSDGVYTITLTCHFKNEAGEDVKVEKRSIEGFPAKHQSYVVLKPHIKFSSFDYEVDIKPHNKPTYL